MSKIVIHAGPGKCGSSSIQNAVLTGKKAMLTGTNRQIAKHLVARRLPPKLITPLHVQDPPQDTIDTIDRMIRRHRNPAKPLILTHEMIFKNLGAVCHLARIARGHSDQVMVVAYIRRQSDLIISSFGQWMFRAPARIREAKEVLRQHDLDPALFWGIERHLIAAILGGWEGARMMGGSFFLDWSKTIPERQAALAPLGAELSIGLLPRRGFDLTLVPDFLERIGLDPALADTTDAVRNSSFHPVMIEAVVNAIEAGHEMPKPHDLNHFFHTANIDDAPELKIQPAFVKRLGAYIDTAFETRNRQIAQDLNLLPDYFAPDEHISIDQIEDEIRATAAERAQTPVDLRRQARRSRAALAVMALNAYHATAKPGLP